MNNNEDFNYLCRKTLDACTMGLKTTKSNFQKKKKVNSHFSLNLYENIYYLNHLKINSYFNEEAVISV